MNILDRYRPEPPPLDPAWSAATLRSIFATAEPATAIARPPVHRRVLAGAVTAVGVVLAVVAGFTASGTSTAFAVEQQSNGDIVVTIHRLTDSSGLEEALSARGIDADVTYLHTTIPSDLDDGSSPSPCAGGQNVGATVEPHEGGFIVTFERSYLDAHRESELLLTAAGGGSAGDWSGMRIEWSDSRC